MTHLRLWEIVVPAGGGERVVAAYRSDGDWAQLFAAAPGFIRTELWRAGKGAYMTPDHWRSIEDFERFQLDRGDDYRRLDSQLGAVAGDEIFIGAFDLVG